MTVLMTTNYADGRHRGQTGEQESGRDRRERGLGMTPSVPLCTPPRGGKSVCRTFRERSRMAYASKCGDSCGRPLPAVRPFASVGLAAQCSRTVDFNFPRKSLRHAPCAADTRRRQKAAFCFTLEFLDRRWYLRVSRGRRI